MIGAASLRTIAETVEKAAKAKDLSGVRRLHQLFASEVQRVADQVRAAG